jgi:hypothetical protein
MIFGYWLRKKRYCRAYLTEQLKLEDNIAIAGASPSAGAYGRGERCAHGFGGEACGKETTEETQT